MFSVATFHCCDSAGVVYFSASGAWTPTGNLSKYSPPYCDEDWTVTSVTDPPLKPWHPSAVDLAAVRTKLNAFHGGGGSYSRYVSRSASLCSCW